MAAWKNMCDMLEVALMAGPEKLGETFHCFSTKLLAVMKEPHFDDTIVESFEWVGTKRDVTSLLLNSSTLRPFLTLPDESSTHDDDASEMLRESGNALFKQSRFDEALKAYNNSILRCQREQCADKFTSRCLPLSYANRSAVLYHLGELQGCVADVDAAIAAGYPANMVHKLHERKVRCLLRLHNYSAAADAVAAARESLSAANLTEKEKQVIAKLLDGHADSCATTTGAAFANVPACPDDASSLGSYPSAPPLSHGTNNKYTALSTAVDVIENDRYGKHVVCKQKIEVGDIVAAEEPLVAVLLSTSLTTHCYYCLQRYGVAFYPCRRCSVALYCSQACESSSWFKYHRYECYKMLALTGCGHPLGHLALRATLVAGLTHHISHTSAGGAFFADQTSTDSPGCPQCPPDYTNLLRQGTPKEAYSPVTFVILPILAMFLALCTNPEVADLIPSTSKSGVGYLHDIAAVILTHLAAFTNRGHFIYESSVGLLRCDATRTASAIYPLINLFNHSCNASVYRTYHGSKVVLRSVCTLQPGDQVFDTYGANYMSMSWHERRLKLACYSFDCKCVACEGNWPTKAVLSRQADVHPLPSCVHKTAWSAGSRQCPPCMDKLSSLAAKLKRLAIEYDSGRDEVLIKTLTKILTELHSVALQPHFLFVDCREKLTFCYDLMGNSHRAMTANEISLMSLMQKMSI